LATIELDMQKMADFGAYMSAIINQSLVGLGLSVGARTGLFDAMATLPPSTSEEIARAADVNERYTREWLALMVTGRVIEYRPATGTYVLPPEHAAFTTTAAGGGNMAAMATVISTMGDVEDEIVNCFQNGGGVPYSRFTKFLEMLAGGSRNLYDTALLPNILPVVPGLVDRLKEGIDVADIGCGSGHAINVMARASPTAGSPATTSQLKASRGVERRPANGDWPTHRSWRLTPPNWMLPAPTTSLLPSTRSTIRLIRGASLRTSRMR